MIQLDNILVVIFLAPVLEIRWWFQVDYPSLGYAMRRRFLGVISPGIFFVITV